MNKEKLQKILMHLIRTKQTFCFGTDGTFYSIDEVMTHLYGRRVSLNEALSALSK